MACFVLQLNAPFMKIFKKSIYSVLSKLFLFSNFPRFQLETPGYSNTLSARQQYFLSRDFSQIASGFFSIENETPVKDHRIKNQHATIRKPMKISVRKFMKILVFPLVLFAIIFEVILERYSEDEILLPIQKESQNAYTPKLK